MGLAQVGRALAVAMASVMVLVACGDDEDSSSATTVAPVTSTTISQVVLDKQKAERIVLTAADLPGYTTAAPDADTPGEAPNLDVCTSSDPVFLRLGETTDTRGARSPEFNKTDTVTVGSAATFAETDDQARATLAALSAASFADCFSRLLTDELKKDPMFTNVTVSTTKLPALTVGDESVGYRSVARFRVSGTPVTVYTDNTFIRSGRTVSVLELTSATTAFPAAERSRLATVLAGRMAAP